MPGETFSSSGGHFGLLINIRKFCKGQHKEQSSQFCFQMVQWFGKRYLEHLHNWVQWWTMLGSGGHLGFPINTKAIFCKGQSNE